MIQRLESLIESLLLRSHGINSVELLNLTLLLVKIHNNGLVVGLAQAVKEVAVLRQEDAVDAAHGIGHVVEELTPHPVTLWAHCVHVAVGVFGRSEIARLCRTANIDVIGLGVDVECRHGLFFGAASENWEFFVTARSIFYDRPCHAGHETSH